MTSPSPPVPAARRLLERNLRLLPWWWVLRWTGFGEGIWVIYLTRERGVTLGEVFLFEAAFSAVQIAAEVPTGIVSDRYSRRVSVIAATAVSIAGIFAFGVSRSLAPLLFAYLLLAVGMAFQSGADAALLFDTLAPLGRGDAFTTYTGRWSALQTAAIALFTVAGAAMVHWVPLWFPFVLSAFASLPALAFAWRIAEPPVTRARAGFVATGLAGLRDVARSQPLWSVVALLAVAQTAIVTMGVALQLVVVGYGAPLWTLGLFVGTQMALSSVGSLIATPVKRHLGLPTTLLVMGVGGGLSLLAGASGIPWLFPAFILPSITFNVLYIHVVDYLSRRVPEERRATTISIASMVASVANVAGTVLIGLLVDRLGLDAALTAAGVGLAALGGGAFVAWLRAGDTASEPALGAASA